MRTTTMKLLLPVALIWVAGALASTAAENLIISNTPAPATAAAPSARLPYGADDVVRLSKANISEDVIVNFIKTSGTIYNLTPGDIVRLRNEGVSDRVVNVMMEQRQNVTAQSAATQAAQAVAGTTAASQANQVVQTTPTYVQSSAPSTVYVIPDSSSSYYGGYSYYYPYSYYGSYYSYGPPPPGPVISFGVGIGGPRPGPGPGPGPGLRMHGPGPGGGGGPGIGGGPRPGGGLGFGGGPGIGGGHGGGPGPGGGHGGGGPGPGGGHGGGGPGPAGGGRR